MATKENILNCMGQTKYGHNSPSLQGEQSGKQETRRANTQTTHIQNTNKTQL